jgi:Zn-dependent peptidase ImmA (M78 family)
VKTAKADAAAIFAAAFIDRFGVDSGRRLDAIAEQIGLKIVEVDADGYEGMLLRVKGRMVGTVALNRAVPEPRRRRFTLAHEIGHYLLPMHEISSSPCRKRDIERWDHSLATREIEANQFAAAALMPKEAVADLFVPEPSFAAIERLARRQETSLTASAYRYVELSGERVAIVWSEAGTIKWSKTSDEFFRRVRNGRLDPQSFAARAFRAAAIPDELDVVPATSWLHDRNLVEDAVILEHSKSLGSYGVLTLLWIDRSIERWREYEEFED